MNLEMALENASANINAANSKRKGPTISIEEDNPKANSNNTLSRLDASGGHFNQIRENVEKNTATITLEDCLACSGCVTSAETILISQQSGSEFLSVMRSIKAKESKFTNAIISLSPQSCESLAILFNLSLSTITQKLISFFKSLGANAVLDSRNGIDIALVESQTEFISRYVTRASKYNVKLPFQTNLQTQAHCDDENILKLSIPQTETLLSNDIKDATSQKSSQFSVSSLTSTVFPLLASECPGWVCFAEKTQGEKSLQYMSSVRSPQQIMGTMVKKIIANESNITPDTIYHVTVMPCYDKKLEASRDDFFSPQHGAKDVDLVLSTGELCDILLGNETSIDENTKNVLVSAASSPHIQYFFENIHGDNPLDNPLGANTSTTLSSVLIPQKVSTYDDFTKPLSHNTSGNSNGYGEAIFRHTSQYIFGVNIPDSFELPWLAGSNPDLRAVSLEFIGNGNYTTYLEKYINLNKDVNSTNPEFLKLHTMENILSKYPITFQNIVKNQTHDVGIYLIYGKNIVYCVPGLPFSPDQDQQDEKNKLPSPTNPMFAMTSKYKIWKAKSLSITLPPNECLTQTSSTSTKSTGTCMLWIGLAYGFRNIQNIIRQGLPSSPNYHYVEVMACPSGCINGGGQIRAVDIPNLRNTIYSLAQKYNDDVITSSILSSHISDMGNDNNNSNDNNDDGIDTGGSLTDSVDMIDNTTVNDKVKDTKLIASETTDDIIFHSSSIMNFAGLRVGVAAGSSLREQKELIQLLEKRFQSRKNTSPWSNSFLIQLYNKYFGSTTGSIESIQYFYTQFKAIESTIASVPKW